MKQEPEDIQRWHKWFAIECNNQAWDLAAQTPLDDTQKREVLSLAYSSVYHWSKIGEPVNDARADTLLAHVHSTIGEFDIALRYASLAFHFYMEHGGEDWELAFAHLEMAYALHANSEFWMMHTHTVQELLQKMSAENAQIVQDEFDRIGARVGR